MKQPREMSPMKAMMGMKRSSTPSARTLKRVSSSIKKASSSVMKATKPSQFMNRVAPAIPMVKKVFGQATFGPKIRLDDGKMRTPETMAAPSAGGKSVPAPNAPTAVAAVAPMKKLSAKALRRAAAAKPAPTK